MVNITSDFLKAFGPEIGVAYGNGFPNSIVTSPQIKISNDSSQEALPVHMSYWFVSGNLPGKFTVNCPRRTLKAFKKPP